MTDRPILFSAPMIKALLAGSKTQTRRVLKPQPTMHEAGDCTVGGHRGPVDYLMREIYPQHMARFRKGDRLYVRETWAEVGSMDPGLFITRADYPACVPRHYENVPPADQVKWRPGIHMPRSRSRLTLTVTDVRVQRLQEITPADAIAEGIWAPANSMTIDCETRDPRDDFQALWNSINGTGSWAANPWVAALTFTVERRNIDV
jgi:hypothetical protein